MGIKVGDWESKPKGDFFDCGMDEDLGNIATEWTAAEITQERKAELIKKMFRQGLALDKHGHVASVFYSFCEGQWEQDDCISHCERCGKCDHWKAWHCSACDKCNYGLSVPCERCGGVSNMYHDLLGNRSGGRF
jgi:hypothetical protein